VAGDTAVVGGVGLTGAGEPGGGVQGNNPGHTAEWKNVHDAQL